MTPLDNSADVTFILPVRNGSNYMREAIDAVLAQSYQNWKFLILDNVSTDDTPEIAKSYVAKDSRFRFVANEKNIGVEGNFLKALSMVDTPYYCYVCHDDKFLDPSAIARAREILKADPEVAMVNTPVTWMDQKSRKIASPKVPFKGKVASDKIAHYCMVTTRNPYGVLILARPELGWPIKEDPELPGTWDLDFFVGLGKGRYAYFLPDSVYAIRFHPGNNTMRDFSTTRWQVNRIAQRWGFKLSAWERLQQRFYDWKTRVSKHLFYFYLDHVRR